VTTAAEPVAVGVDVGGTKLVAGGITQDGTIVGRRRETSPVADPAGLLDAIERCVVELGTGLPIGIGVAGIVDRDGRLVVGPNLQVEDVPIAQEIGVRIGMPVTVGNDANVALWGELVAGAARGARDVAMVTLGTGIGGGLVVAGELVEGWHGYAGELGHLIVEEGGRRCPCGNHGCVEAYASGTSIGAITAERLADGGVYSTLVGAGPDLDGRAVTRAALDGDAFARDVLTDAGTWLGVALASVVNALDPELLVIGGGASTLGAGFIVPAATAAMRPRLLGHERREPPPIVLAELGDDAGMVGAGLLARHRIERRSTTPGA